MPTQTKKQFYTPEEYLELEEKAEFRNEYRDGEIVPMTGAALNHNQITINLVALLHLAFKRKKHRVFSNDLRLWIPSDRIYTYPDIMVIAGKPIFQGDRTDIVTNPVLVAEVLSQSTKNYDKGEKFDFYRSIPELREYILIDQYKVHVMQYYKTDSGSWLLTDYQTGDAVLELASIDLQIPLSEIYEQVDFELPDK